MDRLELRTNFCAQFLNSRQIFIIFKKTVHAESRRAFFSASAAWQKNRHRRRSAAACITASCQNPQGFPFVLRSRKTGLPFAKRVRLSPPMSVRVCQCPSESANVRPSPPLSVQVRHCPSKSANVRPSPPMSVYVRQCPSKSANVRLCPPMSQKPRPLSHRIQKGQDIGGHRRT